MDVHSTSVLEGPTDELGFSELGPQTWVDLRSGTLNTLWGVRHDGRNYEESGEETGDEFEDNSEDASKSEHIAFPAVRSVFHQFFQDTIQNFFGLVNHIKVATKKLFGFVDEENKMDDQKEEDPGVDNSLVTEDQDSEETIVLEEHFHLVSLCLEREELVVKVQYGQRGEASKMVTLHYQPIGE